MKGCCAVFSFLLVNDSKAEKLIQFSVPLRGYQQLPATFKVECVLVCGGKNLMGFLIVHWSTDVGPCWDLSCCTQRSGQTRRLLFVLWCSNECGGLVVRQHINKLNVAFIN